MIPDRMQPQRLASVLDTGEEPVLDWPSSPPPPAVRAAVRFALHMVGLVVVFFVVLVAAGAAMHALRGPHHHRCADTRGTCTDSP